MDCEVYGYLALNRHNKGSFPIGQIHGTGELIFNA